jgi:PAS domain-containing protein
MSAAVRADRRAGAGKGTDPLASPDRLLDVILNGLPQPVYVVDVAGRLVFANPAAIASLGYDDLAELRGKARARGGAHG